jgi:GNAT superfamily N-acetyltransferase
VEVESVRVDGAHRGHGIGSEMMTWAIARAKERGAVLVQLTTHASRKEAHRFYERLGFKQSHVGMKLSLK